MLEVTFGQAKNLLVANDLRIKILSLNLDGSLYIGYPVLATADDSITVDALLISAQHGLVAFQFEDHSLADTTGDDHWNLREDRQNQLFIALENSLRRHETLRVGRRLAVGVQTITVMANVESRPENLDGEYTDLDGLPEVLRDYEPIDQHYFKPLQAALQRVSTIKPAKKRLKVGRPDSKGAVLKLIEREIANLDRWQKRAAIESPEGPQRIRGLAGSGKTIVLALKAAYLHALNPDWTIGVTFWSRSLYQQFEDLVRRFSFEHSNDEPNWQKLRILHAWGSNDREGVYRQCAIHCGLTPRDFLYGRSRYGRDEAFQGVCSELVSKVASFSPEPIYDAMLIDEAQDLPVSFFRIVYKLTRPPKRIIWAFDELQKLSESAMPTVAQQFGKDDRGEPLVTLVNSDNNPHQDIVLPICYRNTPWALSLAHGLGLGTSRKKGLVQNFEDSSLWEDIGYRVVDGELEEGSDVTLERAPDSYPSYFPSLLTKSDAVRSMVFKDEYEQARVVASNIKLRLDEDELDHDDILIVLPDAFTARRQAAIVMEALASFGINGHLAGVTTSQDELFRPDSIAIANIYRSKGNESPMVYVLNAQICMAGESLTVGRNILFTAITRSKAWVRLSGWGSGMKSLEEEIHSIEENDFRLKFRIPSVEEMEEMRRLHRGVPANREAKKLEAEKGLRSLVEALEGGEVSFDELPMDLKSAMAKLMGQSSNDTGQSLT